MPLLIADSDREAALQDLAHEVVALEAAWRRHRSDRLAWTSWFVHARKLLKFFDCPDEDRDELRAFHFIDPPGDWIARKPECEHPDDLQQVTVAANKLAAHLTVSRAAYRVTVGVDPSATVQEYLECLGNGFASALASSQQDLYRGWLRAYRTELAA